MNDDTRDQDSARRQDVRLPTEVLAEQTLAVDLARAEIDQAIATAHKYPRILETFVKKVTTMALYNEDAAKNCIYSLPRGGKPIIGPSIGFANILAQGWGNCRDGARISYIDRKEKMVVAEGVFHDLETNRQIIIPVNRRIVDKNGRLYNDDMIMVTGMAAASIARRNAITNAVPRALWFPIYESALEVVRGNRETFAERKAKALQAFSLYGVKPEQLYMALGLKGETDMTLEHLPVLIGMFTQLRDGNATVEEMFNPRNMTGRGFETIENPLGETGDEEPAAEQAGSGGSAPAAGGRSGAAQAGAGESEPDPAGGESADPAATAQASPAAATQPAAAEVKATEPAAAAKPAVAKAELVAKVAEPAAEDGPKTLEGYVEHAETWLDAAEERNWPPTNVEEMWKSEKKMRERCMVVEDTYDRLYKRYRAVLAGAKERAKAK